ncbi:MAG: M1 family metallopeptidase [Candidatus Aminicenantaceae bacterium]
MKKTFLSFLICFVLISLPGFAELSRHIVHYKIQAKLVPEEKAVIGMETLTWLNDSEFPVSELQFHLYLNAFKNNRTTFMREGGRIHRGFKLDEDEWGYNKIKKIRIKYGPDLTPFIEYIQPDDGNEDDQTVMKVPLPEPVPPHEKIMLDIQFYAKLPKVYARSGFNDDFFMVAQWFPKIGVLEDGEWNCHQYHRSSEFYADFGVYEVEITVPQEYIVGATGNCIKKTSSEDGWKTCTYYQEDVHEFAWTACPDFVKFREPYVLDNPPVETEIILLIHRNHLNQKERYLRALENGIEFYSQNYGAYPYSTITLVDPPIKAAGASGMEYPTLFTAGTFFCLPQGLRFTEMVTIHEFGHGYWYGIVASNEFEEAWLDEGINSYSEIKAMDYYYGEDSSMIDWMGIKISDFALQRVQLIATAKLDPILKKSWEFYSGGSYSVNSYSKAAITLLTLEKYLGEDVMKKIMQTYYERWKFRHPKTQDFIDIAEEVSGEDLGWFFNQFFKSPGKLDYAVESIQSLEIKEPQGIFNGELRKPEKRDKKDDKNKKEKMYKNVVSVIRKGELVFPQDILITFEDGEKIREKWNGKTRWKKFIYFKPKKLKSAQVDPERKMLLDVNFINNSMRLKPKKAFSIKAALNAMLSFQNILSWISY